ncbi:Uncharacterised protein [Klebsiella pneumoniae]|uniref:Uncharacterized protein n=1 Tax=Klebsiella pneumoniae TaxID=573 RepID=A0A377V3A1_KLEPN|nr:Uncharacterised protein [Klebsiella pneumoniae]
MDKFDRTIQRELLQRLCDIYPESADSSFSKEFSEKFGGINIFTANLLYLAGHGLIEIRLSNENRSTTAICNGLFHENHQQRHRFHSR